MGTVPDHLKRITLIRAYQKCTIRSILLSQNYSAQPLPPGGTKRNRLWKQRRREMTVELTTKQKIRWCRKEGTEKGKRIRSDIRRRKI